MQTGPTSPDKPPAAEPAAEAKGKGAAAAEAGEEKVKEEVKEEDEEEGEEQQVGGRRTRRRGAAGDGAVVRVKRELLVRCMTCPLCHRLLRKATTISECLHTFCRKCIYQKLNDEELDSCPVCKIDLGCTPVEKLRADHNIQDVRAKVFPFKRKKVNAEEAESPIALPVKRKERSISSLVVNTPRITPAGSTGRRTRAVTRKAAALRGLGPIIVDPPKKDNDKPNKETDNSNLLNSLSKAPQTRRQVLSNGDTSSHPSGKDKAVDDKDFDKAELWKPLNCLVDLASKTKPPRTSAHSPAIKADKPNESPSSEHSNRTKAREPLQKSKVQDDKIDDPEPIVLLRKKPGRRRKHPLPSANAASTAADSQNRKKINPVWFSLIASFDQKGEPPLPQIPAHYLRIKDGNIPASSIQKYIMQKLNLLSESEVEISCCGQSVNPVQPVRNLVDRWLRVGPARPLQTVIGSSGGDYVMVISYGRPSES
ncbi:hypothetical protein QOZ80_5BG0445290 [Eleusine coracana subsp. coracana]|nr:hypothetical protein QOZ80_5BG0445290 [Eleusine coracana subsp. coracana]